MKVLTFSSRPQTACFHVVNGKRTAVVNRKLRKYADESSCHAGHTMRFCRRLPSIVLLRKVPIITRGPKKTICRKSNRNKMTKDDIVSSVQMMEGHQNMRQFTARFTGYSCVNASGMLMSINAAIIISAVNGGTR